MMDWMSLGPTPAGEECARVGQENYRTEARRECRRYMAQLERQFGPPPKGAGFSVRGFPHDFGRMIYNQARSLGKSRTASKAGTYYETVVLWDTDVPEAQEFAYRVASGLPTLWDCPNDAA